MEQQFKKLLQKSRTGNDPIFRTFEGAIFAGSAWFFLSEETPFETAKATETAETSKQITPTPKRPDSLALSEVLFVGDTYNGEGDDLLGRMISAMKLSSQEFYRFPLEEELENISDLATNLEKPDPATKRLLAFIAEKRPKVVVSLGATITNVLLGKREKLSTIHGQFFEKSAGECVYSLMPLFHPDFLLINPNMKRTAWIDLQKVMERVGKI